MSRTLRLFVAAYPPRDVAERWLAAAGECLPPDVRLVEPDQVHLTLVFLGDRDERELPAIRESIAKSVTGFGSIALRPIELIMLPERGVPRLIAASITLPRPLAEIQRRLAQRLARDRNQRTEFLPHLTLARFPGKPVERTNRTFEDEEFAISEIRLMRSHLLAAGAVHELDKAFPLQP
ncbi:MAG: RNA 2',3'-cyclic phosphodiesterase [Phycisphaerales bacterium]